MIEDQIKRVTVNDASYQVEIEPDPDGGYVATVRGLPGCITQGETLAEVLDMAEDAITCWLEAREDLKRRGIEVPMTPASET